MQPAIPQQATNPLRYRGYYYDSESGFYYLQSRYYDPQIGRFINADQFASTGQGFLGYNMFAYCNNNPINYEDSSGCSLFPSTTAINDGGYNYPIPPVVGETADTQISGTVSGQDLLPYSQDSCGLGTYANNGCGPIAIYNAMQLIGHPQSLGSITQAFFLEHGMVAFGLGGIAPWSMELFLRSNDISYVGSAKESLLTNGVSEGDVIVYTVMFSTGWHAMTALYTRNQYMVFNQYDNSSSPYMYSSLKDSYAKGWFVYGFRLDQ